MTGERRRVLRCKIHRATITDANLEYEGSIALSKELCEAADVHAYEAVQLWNVTRGTRLETYVIEGEAGPGEVCVNGAAAHLMKKGDMIIIANFADIPLEQLVQHKPRIVFVDEQNRVVELRDERRPVQDGRLFV